MLESMNETINSAPYKHKRNVLCDALKAIGFDVRRPEGLFYIYLKTPIPDDVAFTQLLANEGVLAVPGTGFGRSVYIRLSLTIPLERIENRSPDSSAPFSSHLDRSNAATIPPQSRWKTSSSGTILSSAPPMVSVSKNGDISACHRSLTT